MLASIVRELQSAKQAVNTQIEGLRVELGRIDEAVAILSPQSTDLVAQVETRKYIKRAGPQSQASHHVIGGPGEDRGGREGSLGEG